uniref:Uncharacterized protein n=1 Tax=Arundo donax TaxID=35708 RepID=A0A0A9HCT6_ARUDO
MENRTSGYCDCLAKLRAQPSYSWSSLPTLAKMCKGTKWSHGLVVISGI